jgi:hypothetical protein
VHNTRLEDMLRKFITDRHGKVVIMQKPNLAIVVWAVAALLAHLLPHGQSAQGFAIASRTALVVWAILEIGWGASYFRRLLGLIVMSWSIATLFW